MSVLIYPEQHTVSVAGATLFASALMENPYASVGITYDSVLDDMFGCLNAMLSNGVFSFERARIYQLCEFVPGEEPSADIQKLLEESLFSGFVPSPGQYVIPYYENRNWAEICSDFEDDILEHGGIDLALLVLRRDGSLLYNPAGKELAPITHVEMVGSEKIVTAGLATIMRAKKLLVVALGRDVAEVVSKTLGGSVSSESPASYLQLHQNVTFLLDEEAASLL